MSMLTLQGNRYHMYPCSVVCLLWLFFGFGIVVELEVQCGGHGACWRYEDVVACYFATCFCEFSRVDGSKFLPVFCWLLLGIFPALLNAVSVCWWSIQFIFIMKHLYQHSHPCHDDFHCHSYQHSMLPTSDAGEEETMSTFGVALLVSLDGFGYSLQFVWSRLIPPFLIWTRF